MQSQSHAFTPEEQAVFNTLDERDRQRGRHVTSHAEVYHVIKGLAYSQNPKPIVFDK